MADINDFTREVECIYKDERYAVREWCCFSLSA